MSHVKVQPSAAYSHGKFKVYRKERLYCTHCEINGHKHATRFTVILLVISINPSLALSPITVSMVHHQLQFIMFQLKSMMFSLHWSRTSFKHLDLSTSTTYGHVPILLGLCSCIHTHYGRFAWCFFVIQHRYCLSVPMYCDTSSCCIWIMDSGVSRHICFNAKAFISLTKLHNATVTLPNGHVIPAEYVGDIRLNSKLLLRRVLYVPQFKFNLLSVSSLTTDSELIVHFHHDLFFISRLLPNR